MLGAPVTCSFLLTRDPEPFEEATTLRVDYLFHDADVEKYHDSNGYGIDTPDEDLTVTDQRHGSSRKDTCWSEPDDLADPILQCGRRGDALKFFLSWQYYGTSGYRDMLGKASELVVNVSCLADDRKDMQLVLRRVYHNGAYICVPSVHQTNSSCFGDHCRLEN